MVGEVIDYESDGKPPLLFHGGAYADRVARTTSEVPPPVLYAVEGRIATISLNRPETRNALSEEVIGALVAALEAADADPDIDCVVLTGEGRAFSAGQDLGEDLPRGPDGKLDLGPPLARDYNPLIERLAAYPKVTIAALNGPAVGASMNIALACDIVVAARSAYLQEAFARIALIPDAGGTWILPRLVGPKLALALMLTGESVPAEEAQRLGLVYKVFPDESFRDDVSRLASALAHGPGLAYALTKRAVRESLSNDLSRQLALEAELQGIAGRSEDFSEGLAAFREKRAPRFTGR
ncbi:MAG: enoyl-CoA hydratase/isomerase family protein [Blastomonas sp.]|nr:enoyl-CoA hydratase/isomerase family protein [Blastomonas sp.]